MTGIARTTITEGDRFSSLGLTSDAYYYVKDPSGNIERMACRNLALFASGQLALVVSFPGKPNLEADTPQLQALVKTHEVCSQWEVPIHALAKTDRDTLDAWLVKNKVHLKMRGVPDPTGEMSVKMNMIREKKDPLPRGAYLFWTTPRDHAIITLPDTFVKKVSMEEDSSKITTKSTGGAFLQKIPQLAKEYNPKFYTDKRKQLETWGEIFREESISLPTSSAYHSGPSESTANRVFFSVYDSSNATEPTATDVIAAARVRNNALLYNDTQSSAGESSGDTFDLWFV